MFDKDIPDIQAAMKAMEGGRITPRELVQMAESRIDRWEDKVRAFLHLDTASALEAAAKIQGPGSGPLPGIPTVIKDLADVSGMPTTGGSQAYRWQAVDDAPVVHRLRQAGAALLGKTNTQELAFGVITAPTRNPWNLDHIPGGSSGGSAAALASGMTLAALGTDTGGSIRIPAACCGVVGFKPTTGRVPAEGVMPLSYTLDHVGPLAHSVRDANRQYRVMAGLPYRSEVPFGHVKHHRAAVPWTYLEDRMTDDVAARFEECLDLFRQEGWEVIDIAMEEWAVWLDLQLTIRLPEAYLYHRDVLEGPGRTLLGGKLAERLDPGRSLLALDYVRAQRRRLSLMAEWTRRFETIDVVLMPTLPSAAPKVGQDIVRIAGREVSVWEALISLTAPWSVVGFPAISVPAGAAGDELPLALQIIGQADDDDLVLEVAAWFEAAYPHPLGMPPDPG